MVFPLCDDYSFGILQSEVHWEWFTSRCSTLKGDYRYTSNTVFDSFPWPQKPTKAQIKAIAASAVKLREARNKIMYTNEIGLRDLYRVMEESPSNLVTKAQESLDTVVRKAYGMKKNEDILSFLLGLNLELADKEAAGEAISGPGLPSSISKPEQFITRDCVQMA